MDHIKLLQRMYVGWEDCEYGAPAIDCKRPYGNSDVPGDIAEILGWRYDPEDDMFDYDGMHDAARKIHEEMQTVLQILVKNLCVNPGVYERKSPYGVDWRIT